MGRERERQQRIRNTHQKREKVLMAHATEDPECPAFRRCAPRSDVFGFRRASDKEVYCETTLTGEYSVVRQYTPFRDGTLRCKVECEYLLEDGCPFFRRFPFFTVDPDFAVEAPCIETIFAFARGDDCEEEVHGLGR